MMNELNELNYYVARAECSRNLARRAVSPAIAAIHEELGDRYDIIIAELTLSNAHLYREAQAA